MIMPDQTQTVTVYGVQQTPQGYTTTDAWPSSYWITIRRYDQDGNVIAIDYYYYGDKPLTMCWRDAYA